MAHAWQGDVPLTREAVRRGRFVADRYRGWGGVGGSITLGQAIFINVTVSLFAGLMPIPGGVGVSEAGMTAGLTAIGVDPGTAVSAMLIYRLVSYYYLPPLWGYVSLRWLTKHDDL